MMIETNATAYNNISKTNKNDENNDNFRSDDCQKKIVNFFLSFTCETTFALSFCVYFVHYQCCGGLQSEKKPKFK